MGWYITVDWPFLTLFFFSLVPSGQTLKKVLIQAVFRLKIGSGTLRTIDVEKEI